VTLSTFPTEVIVQSGSTNVDVYVYEILKREVEVTVTGVVTSGSDDLKWTLPDL